MKPFRLVCGECFELAELLPPIEWDGPGERPNYRHTHDRSQLCETPPDDDAPEGTPWTYPGPIMVQVGR